MRATSIVVTNINIYLEVSIVCRSVISYIEYHHVIDIQRQTFSKNNATVT